MANNSEIPPNTIKRSFNLKDEQMGCLIDLEAINDKDYKLFNIFKYWLVYFFLLGFLCSQLNFFSNYKFDLETREEVLASEYVVNIEEKNLIDYASSSNGGTVVESLSTGYNKKVNSANEVISDNNAPGKCWGFEGKGTAGIKLYTRIYPQAFTLVHLNSINYSTAPKIFNVYNLTPNEKILIGSYEFDFTIRSESRKDYQEFKCMYSCDRPVQVILLEVLSNHGDPLTCVYQLKVHGVAA